jgi:hypothetical protein
MFLPRASTAAGLLILPQALAQYASNCGTQSLPQYLNASLEYLIRSPFTTPTGILQGGSGDWIWNIGTVSHSLTSKGKSGSVSQSLWLETESFIDRTSPSLGYTGCGAIFHGLTYAATVNGQADGGDCALTLNPPCIHAIQTNMLRAAAKASNLTSANNSDNTITICANLAIPIPPACDPFFTKPASIQTFVFASPDPNTICTNTPASSNYTHPLASWSPNQSTYSYPHAMKSYNNLTTAVSPVFTVMFTNQSFSSSSSGNTSSPVPSPMFVEGWLSCLRPANLSQGSITPSGIPNGGAVNLNGVVVSPSVSMGTSSQSSGSAVASPSAAAASGGADGLRFRRFRRGCLWMCWGLVQLNLVVRLI